MRFHSKSPCAVDQILRLSQDNHYQNVCPITGLVSLLFISIRRELNLSCTVSDAVACEGAVHDMFTSRFLLKVNHSHQVPQLKVLNSNLLLIFQKVIFQVFMGCRVCSEMNLRMLAILYTRCPLGRIKTGIARATARLRNIATLMPTILAASPGAAHCSSTSLGVKLQWQEQRQCSIPTWLC